MGKEGRRGGEEERERRRKGTKGRGEGKMKDDDRETSEVFSGVHKPGVERSPKLEACRAYADLV